MDNVEAEIEKCFKIYSENDTKDYSSFIIDIIKILNNNNGYYFTTDITNKDSKFNTLAYYDSENSSLVIYLKLIKKYLSKEMENGLRDKFDYSYLIFFLAHEYKHIIQSKKVNNEYLLNVYKKIKEFQNRKIIYDSNEIDKIYFANHDQFIIEKEANIYAYNMVKNILQYLTHKDKIYYNRYYILDLLAGYKIKDNKIISAVENNFTLIKSSFDINKYDYSNYSLEERMSSGMPITMDEYNYISEAKLNPTNEKIKEIKRR